MKLLPITLKGQTLNINVGFKKKQTAGHLVNE
jgi:hypothetical protein